MQVTPASNSIRELVQQARRRFFLNVAVAEAVLAASVGMADAILLLVFGAQFLDWRWLASLAILTFPLAFLRTARSVPSPYRVAQVVDARLELRDSISTALYFSEHAGEGRGSASMREAQLAESERIGRQVDPKMAVPLARPRLLYVFGSLFLVATLLFGLRYGLQHKLDLSRPLASILMDTFGGGAEQTASLKKPKRLPMDIWNQLTQDAQADPDSQAKDGNELQGAASPENTTNSSLQQPGATEGDAAGDSKKESDGSKASGENGGEQSEKSGSKSLSNAKDSDPMPGSKEGDNPSGKQPSNSSENNSLTSKIKDAVSSLLNSMKSKEASNSQSSPGKSNGDAKSQQAKSGQKSSGQGEKKAGDQDSADAEDGQQGDTEGGKPGDGKGTSQTADGQPGNNGGSGAGKQEGAKDAKLAAQLAAMGKLSEIIGKRSANVTGEVTIEVTSSKQPIKTPFSEGKAAHGEASGEINRDEVPAAFQDYVQQYFEQVRKPAKGSGKAPATP